MTVKWTQKIRIVRNKQGFSWKLFCDRAEISYKTFVRWMDPDDTSEPGISAALRMARTAGLRLDELFDETAPLPEKIEVRLDVTGVAPASDVVKSMGRAGKLHSKPKPKPRSKPVSHKRAS